MATFQRCQILNSTSGSDSTFLFLLVYQLRSRHPRDMTEAECTAHVSVRNEQRRNRRSCWASCLSLREQWTHLSLIAAATHGEVHRPS